MKNEQGYNLAHFETFMAVVEQQSFTAAAEYLKVTKAAVSQIIRKLETSLEAPLLLRTTRTISLTDEGKLLYQQCQRLQAELNGARELVAGLHALPSGKLRISCSPYYAEQFLLPKLIDYQAKFPAVEVEVLIEERMPDLKNEQIDLVCGVNWPAPLDIVARKIGQTRYVLCATPDYLEKFGTPKTLTDLKNHHYIHHSGRQENTPIVSLKKAKTKFETNVQLKANHIQFIKTCVLNHQGIAQFHDYVIQDELANGTLIEVLGQELKPSEDIFIYYAKHRFVQAKVRQLVMLLLEK